MMYNISEIGTKVICKCEPVSAWFIGGLIIGFGIAYVIYVLLADMEKLHQLH